LQTSHGLSEARDRDLVNAISEEANRLERQVRNLLDMTRIEAGAVQLNREWQSLEELIGSALLRTESLLSSHKVDVDLPADLPLVRLDGVLMEQVFVNLLENAARHTPPGTHVEIAAEIEGGRIRITVANDGPPLPAGQENRIFDKFNRRGTSGSIGFGLGLAICRAILEAHDGTISARNRGETGVVFTIMLPRDRTAPEVDIDD